MTMHTRPKPRSMLEKSKFYNNTEPKTLKNKFQTILSNPAIIYLDFLVGYFRISGYKHLHDLIANRLETFGEIRILVGINVDSTIAELKEKGIDPKTVDPARVRQDFYKDQIQHIQDDAYASEEIEGIPDQSLTQLREALEKGLIQIRIVKDKNVHAKFYIFSQEPVRDRTSCEEAYFYTGSLIVGSSNLTDNGLIKQYEFNAELNQSEDIEIALFEFNALWEESVEITSKDIESIKSKSCLGDFSAEEIYYKMLIEYFGRDRIERDRSIEELFPKDYKVIQYQVDAIKEGLKKLERYNGFFLADVVGLGKTLIATLIAKKLVLSGKLTGNILIVCPPSVKTTWEDHFKDTNVNRHYEVISHDQLDKIKDSSNYELVIVDESHRFKSNTSQRYNYLKSICKESTPYTKKVILLSATPQNNSPEDLEHQIYLFCDPRNTSIGTNEHLDKFFKEIKKEHKGIKDELKKAPQNRQDSLKARIKKNSDKIRDGLLRHIMIRRTRSDIEKLFHDDSELFPKTPDPKPLEYNLSKEAESLTRQTLKLFNLETNEIGEYGYYRYLIYPNLTAEGQAKYRQKMKNEKKDGDFYERTAERLRGLMQSLLFKRFESSIESFLSTMERQIRSTRTLIKMLEEGETHLPVKNLNNLDAYYEALESEDEKREEYLEKYSDQMMTLDAKDYKDSYLENLKNDLKILEELRDQWQKIDEDPKLQKLIEILRQKNHSKILIFTEAQNTAQYLAKKLQESHFSGVLQVDASNRESLKGKIRENFDANYDKERQKDDYQILISTDTLSEGVNMHRSNIIINYDAPWNATRLMQRAGRINRIGTEHEELVIYNFKPSNIGDEILNLGKQIFQKLQSFHYTLGEDSKVFDADEEIGTQGLYGSESFDEEDPEVQFLAEILTLYEKDPQKYQKIASLPHKIRTSMRGEGVSYFYFKQAQCKTSQEHMQEVCIDFFYKIEEGVAKRVEFSTMASHLREHLQSPKTPLDETPHYSDAKIAMNKHMKYLKTLNEEARQAPSPYIGKAKMAINSDLSLTNGQRSKLISALDRGLLSKEEKKIADGKVDLVSLAEKLDVQVQDGPKQNKTTYPKPIIQLSYTTHKG